MNILMIGPELFRRELTALGHRVVTAGIHGEKDVVLSPWEFTVTNAVGACPADARPDLCLIVEQLGGSEHLPSDLGRCTLPVAYYSIDTHLNFFAAAPLARSVDLVLTTQKDYVSRLAAQGPRVAWLPWSFDPADSFDAGLPRDLDFVFVGRIGPERRRRQNLLDLLSSRFSVEVVVPPPNGTIPLPEVSRIFSRAKVVINESISRELNFRVFEALPTGALLLTERIGNGLPEIFGDGRHLVTYSPYDVVEKAAWCIDHPDEARAIAEAGKAEALAGHTREARAVELAGHLESCVLRMDRRGPGRAFFLNLRRGLIAGERDVAMVEATLKAEVGDHPEDPGSWLDLAEFFAAAGLSDAADACYAESWRKTAGGPTPVRLVVQWSLRLLDQGMRKEAAALLTALALARDVPLTGGTKVALAAALKTDIPSPDLFLALASCVEETDDRFLPGFFATRMADPPLNGVEVLRKGLKAGADARLHAACARIMFRAGEPAYAADEFIAALAIDPAFPGIFLDLSRALAESFLSDKAYEFAATAWHDSNDGRALAVMNALRPVV